MKIVRESKSEVSQNTPQMKIVIESKSEVSQNPPQMKIVRESKSEVSQNIPPKLKTLVFFPKSKFHVTQNTPLPKIENFSFLS